MSCVDFLAKLLL